MKLRNLLALVCASMMTICAYAQQDELNQTAEQPAKQEIIKTGLNFGPLPAVAMLIRVFRWEPCSISITLAMALHTQIHTLSGTSRHRSSLRVRSSLSSPTIIRPLSLVCVGHRTSPSQTIRLWTSTALTVTWRTTTTRP